MKKTLICDLNVYDNGHHIAFVNSIMEYAADREDLIFLFNAKAVAFCKGLDEDKRVFFIKEELLYNEFNIADNSFRGKFKEYRLIEQFAREHAAQRVIFLEIDQYQVAIGLSRCPFHITGIYFRPFHLIPVRAGSLPQTLKSLLYHVKKRVLFQVFRLNPKAEPLFLLNDRGASVRYANWFRYLPDPIFLTNGVATPPTAQGALPLKAAATSPSPMAPPAKSIRKQLSIPPAAHVFLAFGAMGARKNIRNTVAAYLEASFPEETVLLIAGKVRSDYREEFDGAVRAFRDGNEDTRKKLIVLDEFIDDDLIDVYFKDANTILLCYSKFYGSSGLMGKAAQHDKTCIVPNQGLLFHLNEEYSLGYAADPGNIHEMANALTQAGQLSISSPGRAKFVQDHNEKAFLRTLLNDYLTD